MTTSAAKATPFAHGDPVRFTASRLGTVESLDSSRFEEPTVVAGDLGTYLSPHPNTRLEGWHVVEVEVDGRKLLVPCHLGQIEPVAMGEPSGREVVSVGLDGRSRPMLRYRDELHLPEHERSIVTPEDRR